MFKMQIAQCSVRSWGCGEKGKRCTLTVQMRNREQETGIQTLLILSAFIMNACSGLKWATAFQGLTCHPLSLINCDRTSFIKMSFIYENVLSHTLGEWGYHKVN